MALQDWWCGVQEVRRPSRVPILTSDLTTSSAPEIALQLGSLEAFPEFSKGRLK